MCDQESKEEKMDQISEQRLALCHQTLREKVQAAAKLCEAQGVYIRVVSGLRTYEEQDQLFFSCHRPDGTRDFTKPWKTNARGGWSNHNFGMAVDVAPSMHGKDVSFDPDWNEVHPAFQIMIRELKAQGLAWGGDWKEKDDDHFQLADVEITPTAENRTLFAQGGLAAVWASYKDNLSTVQGTVTA
jgi:peptidoglycan L-alanyl-D-glutamate endopeptidase CwlK